MDTNELNYNLKVLTRRIEIIKQQRSSLVNRTIGSLTEGINESMRHEKGSKAYSLASSLIQQHNHIDVLDILLEMCKTLQKSDNVQSWYDSKTHKKLDSHQNCQASCTTAIETIIYLAHSSISKENYVPELKKLGKLFQRKHNGQKWFQKRPRRKEQRNPNQKRLEVCPRVISKLSEVDPSPELINDYLNVFREHLATKKEDSNDNAFVYRKSKNHICLSSRSVRKNDEKGIVPKANVSTNIGHNALSFLSPTLPIYLFQPNPHLEIAFDVRTKNPVYVLEKMQRNTMVKTTTQQRPQFWEEKILPPEYRSRLDHYALSGYDRGHLAPAADFTDQKEILDTFNLCNTSPQVHYINISIWAKLEHWCRRIAVKASTEKWGETYIMTGPLWLPKEKAGQRDNIYHYEYPALTGRDTTTLVQVPTHFFKLLVVLQTDLIQKFECFLVPNSEEKETSTSLEDYVISWNELQVLSGLQLFPSCAQPNGRAKIL